MRRIEVSSDVYEEVEAARSWYEAKSSNLGLEFLDELDRAIETITQSPQSWSPYVGKTRRFFLHRFPFAVIYQYDDVRIRILAVMHLRRNPEYWRKRK